MEKKEEIRCFICGKIVTEKDMVEERVEMIKGPPTIRDGKVIDSKKVFACLSHKGVANQLEEETSEPEE